MIIITREQYIDYRSAFYYLNSLKDSIPVELEESYTTILDYLAKELRHYNMKAYAKTLLAFKPEDLSLRTLQKKTMYVMRTLSTLPTIYTEESIALEEFIKDLMINELLEKRGIRK